MQSPNYPPILTRCHLELCSALSSMTPLWSCKHHTACASISCCARLLSLPPLVKKQLRNVSGAFVLLGYRLKELFIMARNCVVPRQWKQITKFTSLWVRSRDNVIPVTPVRPMTSGSQPSRQTPAAGPLRATCLRGTVTLKPYPSSLYTKGY